MAEKQVAVKYSLALFNLGREQGRLESFYRDLKAFQDLLAEHRELEGLFYYHQLPPGRKKRVLKKILEGHLSEQILNLLLLLVDKRREGILKELNAEFTRLYYQEKGISRVEVISAVELTPEQLELIKERLKELLSTEIRLSTRLEPEIIGGLIIRVGDYLIDGSIRKELASIRERVAEIGANELEVAVDAAEA